MENEHGHPGDEVELSRSAAFFEKLHKEWVEVIAAVLLALATISSAWSAYQAARWHGIQADHFNRSNADRVHASEQYDLADQELAIDVEMFVEFVDAYDEGDAELMGYYMNHLFRDEMRVAMEAWIDTEPLTNPEAPDSPFDMEEYSNSHQELADFLDKSGEVNSQVAREAINHADDYVMFTVLFASVLFFAGVSTKFKAPWVKISLLILGWVVFVGTLTFLFFMPVA